MTKPLQQDFTQGNILKQLITFSGPLILANLLQTSYQFIDSLWVGNLIGDDALGSVSISSTIIFIVLALVLGINNAQLTILSQQRGKDSEVGLRRYLNAFVVILSILGIILGILGFFLAEFLLKLIGTPKEMVAGAKTYLQINFLGIIFLIGYNFISTVLRSLGDSKTPLRIVALAVSLNVVLDPLFISGLNLGIAGVAYATIVSQALSFFIGLYFILKKRLAPFSIPFIPKKEEVKLILNLGIPAGLQSTIFSTGSAAIMSVVTSFGPAVVAGYSAAQRIDSMIMLPAHALGTAVNSMAGQNIGKGNMKRVNQIAKTAVLYNFAIMTALGLLVIAFGRYGVVLFISEDEAIQYGTRFIQVIALTFPFLGINFVLNGIVRASGAMYQVLALNIISFWVLRVPLSALFAKLFGEVGVAIGMGTSFIISSLIAFLYFKYGKWREKVLFK